MKCKVCNNLIETMCFKGTGVCCEQCRKVQMNGDGPSSEGNGEPQPNIEGDRLDPKAAESDPQKITTGPEIRTAIREAIRLGSTRE